MDLQAKINLESILDINATLFVKVDNIFDHLNETSVYSSTGSAEYNARLPESEQLLLDQLAAEGHFSLNEVDLRPNYYSSPRKVQVGLEIGF